jgi:hypothetical protein
VLGFWADNWLAPHCKVLVRDPAPGIRLRAAGSAALDMDVTVLADGRVVGRYSLKGGVFQTIEPDLTSHLRERPVVLEFEFSASIVDAADRRLSFLLQETNLFGESDVG